MKVPRFRIAWVMLAVAIAALNFAVIRAFVDSPSPWGEGLLLGALPMANVMALGLLIARQRPGSRPFIRGFVASGAMALALYAWLSARDFPDDVRTLYVKPCVDIAARIIGREHPYIFVPSAYFGVVAVLALPQLAVALVGGYFSRRHQVTVCINRR